MYDARVKYGGGVQIAVRNNLSVLGYADLEIIPKIVSVEILVKSGKNLLLCAAHLPPNIRNVQFS